MIVPAQFSEIFQIKDPTILLLIIIFFFVIAGLGAIRSTTSSSQGFQTLATNMAGNYQVSSAQALTLTEKVGQLSVRVTQLDSELAAVKARLKDSDARQKDTEKQYREALDKIDVMSNELAVVRKQLSEASTALILREAEKAALTEHVGLLQLEVDKLRAQILQLQSVSPTALVDPPVGALISQEIQSNITTTTTTTITGESS